MESQKMKTAAFLFLKSGLAVEGFDGTPLTGENRPALLAQSYENLGADMLVVFDLSRDDEEHEASLNQIREIARVTDFPVIGCGNIRRTEDVKKLLYAGCRMAILNYSKESNREMTEEVSKRFGKEKIGVSLADPYLYFSYKEQIQNNTSQVLLLDCGVPEQASGSVPFLPVYFSQTEEELIPSLKQEKINGVCSSLFVQHPEKIMEYKHQAKEAGVSVNLFESTLSWEELRKNSDGLIPAVVQDYKTLEVLMVAYMNQEAFETTLRTGKMTYYSRSRRELWIKGSTSGHFQYVRQLSIDCDNDTILARVLQIGSACHTGNRSCFYRDLVKKDYADTNPMTVFEKVYGVIQDRKVHPKEGSYTNYLFDKGIDKILKKVGEEATEIVIAAKNPNPEEIKYEISDFLYHVMVLMAEKGVTWEDITKELANR
ncbi:MAG: bifunctional phosphoribosyl-AMP cyclohydrolase/phosphoribosyl-ATP diphosphatase HisIE [Candidatus Limivivens sp.]|nr:bifunctional phosphoribosyl-AMP cyclohydrolase/phosphoribosyl-ATP diphosphatase HisIE [Candidatus Limivivens sp.]